MPKGVLVQVQSRAPKFRLKGAISAFFRVRSINNRASHEENTNLAPFNSEFLSGTCPDFVFDYNKSLRDLCGIMGISIII